MTIRDRFKRFFSKPVFPSRPTVKAFEPREDADGNMHIDVDPALFYSLPEIKVYREAINAVYLPIWWRVYCRVFRKCSRPSIGPLQGAFDSLPFLITKNTTIHLSGTVEEDAELKGRCFDGGTFHIPSAGGLK
jgi:hypothetical protein